MTRADGKQSLCAGCGGPHQFDTSVPSPLWNQVIRTKGLPEFLCTTCIVREFVRAGVSFSATLWSVEHNFRGLPISVSVGGNIDWTVARLMDENAELRAALSFILDKARDALAQATS